MKSSFDIPIYKKGINHSFHNDVYYFLIEASWRRLLTITFFAYLLTNLTFASLYLLVPGSISELEDITFLDSFFFSVQTISTIGFGSTYYPTGMYSNFIVTLEAACGLLATAVMTGLVFAKISRPNSKIVFSDSLLDTTFDGERVLQFRIGNMRGNEIIEAVVSVVAIMKITTKEGQVFNKLVDIPLVRNTTPLFSYTWMVTHKLDKDSPLFCNDLRQSSLQRIIVIISGHDGAYSGTIYNRHVYKVEDILKDKYFEDVVSYSENDSITIDYDKFQSLK